jgi:hypothetical protein
MAERLYVPLALDDAFSKEEARGQLFVVARGPHGDGHIFPGEADLQGLFHGQLVVGAFTMET